MPTPVTVVVAVPAFTLFAYSISKSGTVESSIDLRTVSNTTSLYPSSDVPSRRISEPVKLIFTRFAGS